MPERAYAQPPCSVNLAFRVDDDLDFVCTAQSFEPVVGRGLGAVGNGYAMDRGVCGGKGTEGKECFLCNYCISAKLLFEVDYQVKYRTWTTAVPQERHDSRLPIIRDG